MKPIKTFLWVSGGLVAGLVAVHLLGTETATVQTRGTIPTTSYGAFLAAQHALYTNNFDKADELLDKKYYRPKDTGSYERGIIEHMKKIKSEAK